MICRYRRSRQDHNYSDNILSLQAGLKLEADLDDGEAAAIARAEYTNSQLLIERTGFKHATKNGSRSNQDN